MAARRIDAEGARLEDGIGKANDLIAELARRDGVDTAAFGFMVRKAGKRSIAIHPGLHASEIALTQADDRHDPRRPRAQVGLTLSGSPNAEVRAAIEARHDRLVELQRWTRGLEGRKPTASDMLWDPVLLRMLTIHGADLDAIAASGPGEFANPAGKSVRPGVASVVDAPNDDGLPYLGIVDGNHVRVEQIRYAPGIFYVWRRGRPGVVELSVTGHALPHTVRGATIGSKFSVVVGHPSLDAATIGSVASTGKDISFKRSSDLVSIEEEAA